jgi:transcriptional regulator with XRE-family HTH domain
VNIPLVIKHRLKELGFDQKDLAAATQVTESYISQLLARKKAPPASSRTDIDEFLKLPNDELSKLADLQRQEGLRTKIAEARKPLFEEFRELILRKCSRRSHRRYRIFEKEPSENSSASSPKTFWM